MRAGAAAETVPSHPRATRGRIAAPKGVSHAFVPFPFVLALALTAALPQLAAAADAKFSGFLCCNMRSDGSWISDSNYAEDGKRVIPAGTPVQVTGYGRYRVNVLIDGKKQSIGNDYRAPRTTCQDLEPGVASVATAPERRLIVVVGRLRWPLGYLSRSRWHHGPLL